MSAAPQLGSDDIADRIGVLLKAFKLPSAAAEMVPRLLAAGHEEALATVREVLEVEAEDRRQRRIVRLRRAAKLPPGKTFDTFNEKRLPAPLARRLKELAHGAFVDEAINVLAFGLPGTGKSHACAALGHALIEAGHAVLFVPTFALVQDLLAAKRDLALPRALRKLDLFDVVVLDDLGYVQQSADETEVLFTLLSDRYERRSLVITSNLVFSQWEQIFKNPMTTAAAIDRVVHHSVILEFDVPSYRGEAAQTRKTRAARSAAAPTPEGD
jgi:DNA replication protein DnaC